MTGTGTSMAAHANVAEHLYECLGVICGRFLREGEVLPNPGVIFGGRPRRAQVDGPSRAFEKQPKSRVRGAVRLQGESATPTLAEEILTPGPGRVRGLLVSGGNPAGAIPDPAQVAKGLRALDLLVTIDPRLTQTGRLAHYVLPPKQIFEHADMTFALELTNLSYPYAQYTPPIAAPPPGSELCDEGYVCWALAKRLGKTLQVNGVDLDMTKRPSDDDLLAIMARFSAVPFEELKRTAIGGKMFDLPPRKVEAATAEAGRFDVMPADVAAELQAVLGSASFSGTRGEDDRFSFRLIARRVREVCNTAYHDLPSARARMPFNPLYVHPDDLSGLGLRDGERVQVISDHGQIPAIVASDATMKAGVVSMAHGFGGMAGDDEDYLTRGANVGALISLDRDYQTLQSMPRMSGIPVRIQRASA